jgi:signal transduction histidine kinase
MKTLYKKVMIIGAAALLLEIIIVYFLYTSINAFYSDLTNKIAYLLVEQVKYVIDADKLDIYKLSPYNKYPTRRLMNRFSGENSQILHLLLIDTTNTIVVSDDPAVEGKEYTSTSELERLQTNHATIIGREWEGNQEIVDVVYPLIQSNTKTGYLRAVISVRHLENFYQNRRKILVIASLIALGILVLTVVFTSKIYQSNLESIGQAIDKLHAEDYQYRVNYQRQDEFAPVFTRLNQLFEKTLNLNESFRQSEDRINAMMRVIHEGLMILDENMKIISFNEYLLDILHIRHHKNPAHQIYYVLQKNPKLLEIYRRARDPMTHAVRKAMTIRLPDKTNIDVQINALSINEGENANSIIFYIKNLAVLKELEQNLHRSMKYTVISQLASSIGHEIRNPLSSLAIHTEVLSNVATKVPAKKEQSDRINKSINILNSEIERLTKLIDQFFNLAKPKEIELTYENINNLVSEVLELVQQEAYEKSVSIHKHLGSDLPMVKMSLDQIKQVVINIMLNAFDAMPDGGKLYIATRKYEDRVALVIRDTGKGIPPHLKDKIFDLYFSTKTTGGGIGLAISKKIVEAHEGKIYFKSKIGQGTNFVMELPRS